MGGEALRNFRMFQAVCGQSAMKNAVIVLNMWDEVKLEMGEAREGELRESDLFFKPAVTAGASLMRHDNTKESAMKIIDRVISQSPEHLEIQREIVDEKKAISMTKAGLALLGDLADKERRHTDELRRVREEREEAKSRKDTSNEIELSDMEQRLEGLRRKLEEEQERLTLRQRIEEGNIPPPREGRFRGLVGYFMSLVPLRRLVVMTRSR